jgi:hypothetical protein
MLLQIFRHFDVRYTANFVSNTAHIVQFTLCELWSRTYTKYLQLRIFRLQNSAERIALQLEISLQFNARYSANLESNTAHIVQIILCLLWSRTYTIYLQLLIFRPQYSTERICPAIGDITTIQCALYSKLCAKYSAYHPLYAVGTVVPDIYNVITAPHNQASIFY